MSERRTSAAAAGLVGALAEVMTSALGSSDTPLDATDNVLTFIKRYGISIDGVVIDYEDRYKHLGPIAEDTHTEITMMAGAQTGKSVLVMLNLARDAITEWGAMLGYYFPDYHLPRAFSSQRFAPFIRASEDLGPWLGTTGKKGEGADAVFTRNFGPTTLFFLSVKGKTATEGLPMRGVYFDEVRRMEPGDIERAEERTSAQTSPRKMYVSTANYPEQDIHKLFLAGDQRYFHTGCDCPDGVVLSLTFPSCIEPLNDRAHFAPDETSGPEEGDSRE